MYDMRLESTGGRSYGQIFVKTLTGRTVTLDVGPDTTLAELKCLMENRKGGIPPDQLRFIHVWRQSDGRAIDAFALIDDDFTLADYGVRHENVLHAVLRLRSGE